jgi:uncharacterized protein
MWFLLGKSIVKNRIAVLIFLLGATIFMGIKASKVKLSYEFNKAIPQSNEKYIAYQNFTKQFGADGNLVVVGFNTNNFFDSKTFHQINDFASSLEKTTSVTGVLSICNAINLVKDSVNQKFIAQKIFDSSIVNQHQLDSAKAIFYSLPIYKSLVYTPTKNAYLMGITVDKNVVNSNGRTKLMQDIETSIKAFEQNTGIVTHTSGLPFIRTKFADSIKAEMNYFIAVSLLLSAIVLLLFFKSFSTMIMSLLVVGMGVVWSFGTMVLFGFQITLLSAIIAPLVIVIGIPNCIYFLNKYHSSYQQTGNKMLAIENMVGKMGIVTLFCNIAAAIGFAVFALTKSALLQEFGLVAGINIMLLFLISLLFIPSVLSFLPAPSRKETKYLQSKILQQILVTITKWVFTKHKLIYVTTLLVTGIAIVGLFKLKREGFIVDDLPKNDKIYTDLKWFETNFDGIMPLEIVIDTKKKKGLQRSIQPIEKIEEFSNYINKNGETARPLSFVEGLKFFKQSFYDGDSNSYAIPTGLAEMSLMSNFLKPNTDKKSNKKDITNVMNNFIDSNQQMARISVNMKDIGSVKLPILLNDFKQKANTIFDSSKYNITFTGGCVTFLEGSTFIINGLKESIFYAFILIAICMLYLFTNIKILLCSLIPNIIPLAITAGVMGWVGIALKPSTVLVFSVALGIVIDVTIRFLVNYKQELPINNFDVQATIASTIAHTGISILYTSLVLIAGFIIFCLSKFGGTQALGWLTSLTLVLGTLTNLILLPVLINTFFKNKK